MGQMESKVNQVSEVSEVREESKEYLAPQDLKVMLAHQVLQVSQENKASRDPQDLLASWAHLDQVEFLDKMDRQDNLVTVVSLEFREALANQDLLV